MIILIINVYKETLRAFLISKIGFLRTITIIFINSFTLWLAQYLKIVHP